MQKRSWVVVALGIVTGCAALQPERRLAPQDQQYRVTSVAVVPFSLTFHACPDDIDH
jgi:hypothetical protein